MYRLVRWPFAAFFIDIGFLYEDAWAAFVFGGILLVTGFFKPYRCLGAGCDVSPSKRKILSLRNNVLIVVPEPEELIRIAPMQSGFDKKIGLQR